MSLLKKAKNSVPSTEIDKRTGVVEEKDLLRRHGESLGAWKARIAAINASKEEKRQSKEKVEHKKAQKPETKEVEPKKSQSKKADKEKTSK